MYNLFGKVSWFYKARSARGVIMRCRIHAWHSAHPSKAHRLVFKRGKHSRVLTNDTNPGEISEAFARRAPKQDSNKLLRNVRTKRTGCLVRKESEIVSFGTLKTVHKGDEVMSCRRREGKPCSLSSRRQKPASNHVTNQSILAKGHVTQVAYHVRLSCLGCYY